MGAKEYLGPDLHGSLSIPRIFIRRRQWQPFADGRDMGTVVFPDAPLKVFLTASAEERARRRYLQLKAKGDDVSLSGLLDEIRARDERDTQRAIAPLKPAADAIQLDSTELSIEQVLERIMSEIALRDIAG